MYGTDYQEFLLKAINAAFFLKGPLILQKLWALKRELETPEKEPDVTPEDRGWFCQHGKSAGLPCRTPEKYYHVRPLVNTTLELTSTFYTWKST